MSTVADQLASHLQAHGVTTVYGLPGGASLPILAALQRHGIKFVLVRNESSAVYMAGVTARLTGTIGVSVVTLGPGAANAMAGVAHAYLDRSPLLIITADFPAELLDRHTHQVIDLAAMFRPVTKLSCQLSPEGAGQQIREAIEQAVSGRPGPVHLSLPGAVADAPFRIGIHTTDQPDDPDTVQTARRAVSPEPTALAAARKLLKSAHHPIIVTGLGLEPDAPYDALRELAKTLNAPLLDTPKGKGALPASHPLFGGTIGLMQSDPPYELLDEADCIIAVGFDVVELVRIWDYEVPLIWIATWENADPVIPAVVSLVGPLQPMLEQLIDSESSTATGWGAPRVAAFREKLAARQLGQPLAERLFPQQLLRALHEVALPTTTVATDVGSHKILSALEWPAETPNRYFVSNGLSAMGYGLPAALAAALVLDELTVCITGDAGFSMVIGELSLIQEHNLKVITIVMNDAALDLIRAKQLRRAEPVYGTEFYNPSFAAIAAAYDLPFYRVDSETGCRQALQSAFASGHAALIEVMIDPTSYPTSPTQAGTP